MVRRVDSDTLPFVFSVMQLMDYDKKTKQQANDNTNNANITETQRMTIFLLIVESLHQPITW